MKKSIIMSLSWMVLMGGLAQAKPIESGIVNINSADQSTLSATPGIGKIKAKTIVEYRKDHGPFKEVHDLTHVKGISEKVLKSILKRNPGKIVVS